MDKKPLTIDEMAEKLNKANGTLTAAEARVILETEAQTRIEACRAKVQKVLDEYQCTIDVMVILKAGEVIPRVQIVSR